MSTDSIMVGRVATDWLVQEFVYVNRQVNREEDEPYDLRTPVLQEKTKSFIQRIMWKCETRYTVNSSCSCCYGATAQTILLQALPSGFSVFVFRFPSPCTKQHDGKLSHSVFLSFPEFSYLILLRVVCCTTFFFMRFTLHTIYSYALYFSLHPFRQTWQSRLNFFVYVCLCS